MLITTYGRSQILRLAAMLIAVILLGFTLNKLYFSAAKMHNYSKAKTYWSKADSLSAEEYYQKAALNSHLQYHEQDIVKALEELKPVTEIKAGMQAIIDQSNESVKAGDSQALVAAFDRFQISKKAAAGKQANDVNLYNAIVDKFGMEAHFADVFAEFSNDVSADLQAQIKKQSFSDDTVASMLAISARNFGTDQERQSELRSKLESYDQARIDRMAADKPFADALKEGVRLQKFYREHKIQPDWLVPKIEQFAIGHLKALLDKKDTASFARDAKVFEQVRELADSEVVAYIRKEYTKKLQEAESLGSAHHFAQAIEAFQTLDAYRDTSKRIQKVELQWASEEPAHILQKVLPNMTFSSVTNGRDKLGALVYAFGITDGKLVLARMLPDMSMDKKEANLDKHLKTKQIRMVDGISAKGMPVLLVEGSSSVRKSRYVAYEVQSSGLSKILDVEADGYQMDKPGLMVVDNAVGSGAGQKAFFAYRDGEYSFSGIKPDYVEITLKDLPKYKNVKVRFNCTILAADGNTAVVLYNGDYILLHGKSKMQPGAAMVTGTWVSNEFINKGSQEIPAYNVQVFSATQ